MQYCEKCRVKIKTEHHKCPLCHGGLSGSFEGADQVFPLIKEPSYPGRLFFKWYTFVCIAVSVAVFAINSMISPRFWWSAFVAGGILCMWVALSVAIYKRRNLLKNALWQLVLVSAAALIWDFSMGWYRWSIDFVLPCIIVVTIVFMITVVLVQHLLAHDYMIYFFIAGVLGLLPLVLVLTGSVTILFPSVICVSICFLFLMALVIFQGKTLGKELYKKFHF